ncbi:MFS transporter [Rhodococcus phenolicus]|uniref:MFS transporter n=1 Tax=Rhodococcus phenolicus TaxID=263849 RepID=UPI0008303F4E|nr:MFS transporter [Rhodococcus phenolicus]
MSPDHRKPQSDTAVTALLSLAGLVVALQTTLVVPLLPNLPGILGVSDGDATWLVTITLLTGAVATPIVSRMADMYGKRRMMILSLSMMLLGSLVAAIGGTYVTVLVGRAFQGFSSALIPVAMAVLRDVLPREKVASGVAMVSATMGIGGALGLPAAGVLFDHFGWSSVFWVSAAAGALLLTGILILVPAGVSGTPGRFDVLGAVLLSLALVALLLGISKGPAWGWTSPRILLSLGAAVLVLAAWVPYELRAKAPMVDLRISVRRPVLLTNLAGLFVSFAAYANTLATTQQLQLPEITGFGFGLSAATAGLCMVPGGMAMMIISPLSARITGRFGARTTLVASTLLMTLAYAFRMTFDDTVVLIVVGSVLVSIGNALAFAVMPILIMNAVPLNETAAANGVNSLLRTVGSSSMSAVVAALLTGITVEAAGHTFPGHAAFVAMFAVAGAATLLATLAGVFLPRPARARIEPVTTPESVRAGL